MSYIKRFFQLSLALCCLLFALSACSQPTSNAQAHTDGPVLAAGVTSTPQPTPTPTQSVPDSGSQTCPTGDNGRAASLPDLPPGKSNELIYLTQQQLQPNTSTLMRYDSANQTSQAILQISTTAQVSASISPNGQWILLISIVNEQQAIQIVRADGQDLQTLYCAPAYIGIETAQFSPDQHLLAFNQVSQDMSQSMLLVLDLTNGQVHTVLSTQDPGYPQSSMSTFLHGTSSGASLASQTSPLDTHVPLNPLPGQSNLTFQPQQWINNTSLYLSGAIQAGSPGPIPQLYILHDINASVTQQQSNVQPVAAMTSIQNCNNFDITPDDQHVVCSISTQMGWTSPAQIQVQTMAGGTVRTVYNGPNGGITTTRAISNSTLVFTLSQNGQPDTLWKINTDGSGLTQLAKAPANTFLQFADNGYQPWSILSPDGMFYVINENNNSTQAPFIGRFNQGSGGASRGITLPGNELVPIGWTQYA